ncbi:MAG: hypothetical protein KF852_05850 [Saprospiraceae bacterium]|nr:hypothetical protein [Saprospiraceae bacterium]
MHRYLFFPLIILLFSIVSCSDKDFADTLVDDAPHGVEYRSVESLELLVNEIVADSIFLEFVKIQNSLTQKIFTEFENLDTLIISQLDQKLETWEIGDTLSVDDFIFIRNLLTYSETEFDSLVHQAGQVTLAMKNKYATTFAQFTTQNQVDTFLSIWANKSMGLFYFPGSEDSSFLNGSLEFRFDNCCGFNPLCYAQERCINEACASYDDRSRDLLGTSFTIWTTHIAVLGGIGGAFGLFTGGLPGAAVGAIEFGSFGISSGAIHGGIYYGRNLLRIRNYRASDCEHCRQHVECDE